MDAQARKDFAGNKMTTELERITITKEYSNISKCILWYCLRERKEGQGGEAAGGFKTLEDVFDYIRAHDETED